MYLKNKKYLWGLFPIFLVGIVIAYFLFFQRKVIISTSSDSQFFFQFNLPESLYAGSKLSIKLPQNTPNCQLLLNSSWGTWWLDLSKYEFNIPDSVMMQSGLLDLSLFYDKNLIAEAQIFIKPLQPFEPLETFLGSKSIIADGGEHWSMITAIPTDKFINPVYENTPVHFGFKRPNGTSEDYDIPTKHLVSFKKIYSQQKVGKTIISIKAANAAGKEKELLEISGYPRPFNIENDELYLYADARQYFKLKTGIIKDKFENVVSNGTLVSINIKDTDGSNRQLTSYTIGGIARLMVQNPNKAGTMQISANIYGDVESNQLNIKFQETIKDFKISYNKQTEVLKIGPLIGAMGQYIADGAEVEVILNPRQENLKALVIEGYAKLNLKQEQHPIGEMTVRFVGIEKRINIQLEAKEINKNDKRP
jgi:hypothetical protein